MRIKIKSWTNYYTLALKSLETNNLNEAQQYARKCFEYVKYDLESDHESKQIILVEQYLKTIILLKDIASAGNCSSCAEKHLIVGLRSLQNLKTFYPCTKLTHVVLDKAINNLKYEIRIFYISKGMFFKDCLFSFSIK